MKVIKAAANVRKEKQKARNHKVLLRRLNVAGLYPAEFFICKAEEGGVAVATPTDDNAADGKLCG